MGCAASAPSDPAAVKQHEIKDAEDAYSASDKQVKREHVPGVIIRKVVLSTDERRHMLQELFAALDQDESGEVDREEFDKMFDRVVDKGETTPRTQSRFSMVDADHNGKPSISRGAYHGLRAMMIDAVEFLSFHLAAFGEWDDDTFDIVVNRLMRLAAPPEATRAPQKNMMNKTNGYVSAHVA